MGLGRLCGYELQHQALYHPRSAACPAAIIHMQHLMDLNTREFFHTHRERMVCVQPADSFRFIYTTRGHLTEALLFFVD